MHKRGDKRSVRRARTGKQREKLSVGPSATTIPQIYEVVVECRHEAEQRAVFERMRGEGYRCRVITL
jgi:hypothetical protein